MSVFLRAGATARSTEAAPPPASPVVPRPKPEPPIAAGETVTGIATGVGKGRRNVSIDVLRGYCIVMMITSHVGTQTYVNNGVHLLRFVSGAEGFVFLAGLVLGMVYHRKLNAAPAIEAYRTIWKRAGLLWAVHCILTLSAIVLNANFFHYPDFPNTHALGVPRLLWLTMTLRFQPGHMLNILPMYVFLLGFAPLAFELLRRGKTPWLLAVSTAIFLYCQWEPGLGRWVDPVSGGEAFPPLAWQGLFIPGLCVGYHSASIRSTLLTRYRRPLLWGLSLACVAMIVLVSVQTPTFQFYNHEAWDLALWERHPLRVGRVLYFFLSISAFYLLTQAWNYWVGRRRLPEFPLRFLGTLGRNSLYAFLVHIGIAFVLGAFQISPERWLLLECVPVATVAAVYLLARYQVARRWIPN